MTYIKQLCRVDFRLFDFQNFGDHRPMMFLAEETVFQQQVRELWSIGGTLTFIAVMLVIVIIIGGACAARLGRLRNIGLAVLEEHRKGNKMLQYLNERAYDEAIKKKPAASPPEAKTESEIYRI